MGTRKEKEQQVKRRNLLARMDGMQDAIIDKINGELREINFGMNTRMDDMKKTVDDVKADYSYVKLLQKSHNEQVMELTKKSRVMQSIINEKIANDIACLRMELEAAKRDNTFASVVTVIILIIIMIFTGMMF